MFRLNSIVLFYLTSNAEIPREICFNIKHIHILTSVPEGTLYFLVCVYRDRKIKELRTLNKEKW